MKTKFYIIIACFLFAGLRAEGIHKKKSFKNRESHKSHVIIENDRRIASTSQIHQQFGVEKDAIVSNGKTRSNNYYNTRSTDDTMSYCEESGGQFIFSPGEYVMIMYQMPSNGIITGFNIPVFEWGDTTETSEDRLEVSLWKVTYPYDSDGNLYSTDNVDGFGWAGYGWDGSDAFTPYFITEDYEDYYGDTDDEIGPCNDTSPIPFSQDLVLEKVWPLNCDWVCPTLQPEYNPAGQDNWFTISDWGGEPEFFQDERVGILVENQSANDSLTIGFYYCEGQGLVEPWVFAKFYNKCNGTSGEGGWHIRHWVLDFPLAVDLIGVPFPQFQDYTILETTLSTDERYVEVHAAHDDPGGGPTGIDSVSVYFTIDDTNWTEIELELTSGTINDGIWSGYLPGQEPGTLVQYYYWAMDVFGNTGTTAGIAYYIYQANSPVLFINNSIFDDWVWYYYFYDIVIHYPWWSEGFDTWSFGEGTLDLFQHYETIIDLAGGGPQFCHDFEDLRTWLDTGNKNLVVAGDEWLGECFYGWEVSCGELQNELSDGDFNHDVFGISGYYPDINDCTEGDTTGVSRLITVEGDLISGELADFLSDSLELNYDPGYEIGAYNWLDGIVVVEEAIVPFWGVSGIIDSATGIPSGNDTLATSVYMTHSNNNQTAFFGFDVLSLNTSPSYYWIGISLLGAMPQTLLWMDVLNIEDTKPQLPSSIMLYPNYPNPFNPVTTIRFSVKTLHSTSLQIFDITGRLVETLMSGKLVPGFHSAIWDASEVASGVYFCRLTSGGTQSTQKMVLLK